VGMLRLIRRYPVDTTPDEVIEPTDLSSGFTDQRGSNRAGGRQMSSGTAGIVTRDETGSADSAGLDAMDVNPPAARQMSPGAAGIVTRDETGSADFAGLNIMDVNLPAASRPAGDCRDTSAGVEGPPTPPLTQERWRALIHDCYGAEVVSPPSSPPGGETSSGDVYWGDDSPASPLVAGMVYEWHPFILDESVRSATPDGADHKERTPILLGTPEHRTRLERWSTERVPSEGSRGDRPHHFRPRSAESDAYRRQRQERRGRPVLDWDADGKGFFRPLEAGDIRVPAGGRVPAFLRRHTAGRRQTNKGPIEHFPPFEDAFKPVPSARRRRSLDTTTAARHRRDRKRSAEGRDSGGLSAPPLRRSRRVGTPTSRQGQAETSQLSASAGAADAELEEPDISID